MLNDALSTYTYDAESRIATAPPSLPHVLFVPVDGGERDVELFGGVAGADEVEGMAAAWGWEQMVHLGI